MKPYIYRIFLITLLLTGTIACSKKQPSQIIKDVSVNTELIDNEIYLSLDAILDFGVMSLTSIDLPITDPNEEGKIYGRISFKPTLNKKTLHLIALRILTFYFFYTS